MIHVDAFMFMLRHAPLRVSLVCIIALDGPHVFLLIIVCLRCPELFVRRQ
jgi:hypothetical protein